MWRHFASNFLTIFVVGLFLLGGVLTWATQSYKARGPLESAICLKVDPGSHMPAVVQKLAGQGAISNARIFEIGVDYTGKSSQLKAGSYLIPAGASMADIADQITTSGRSTCGAEIVYRIGVTRASVVLRELDPNTSRYVELASFSPTGDVPANYDTLKNDSSTRMRLILAEGVTSWQTVTALRDIDILTGSAGDAPPEGSLAPGSYDLRKGADRADLVAKMQENQADILETLWQNRGDDTPVETMEQALILASIIEKETAQAEERPLVASVFANRLKRGMKLQTDPTVIYGITRGQGVLGRGLRRSELRRETPWNTYVIDGLPPTPIANPGRESIAAAISPAQSDYIFFVADGTGGHAFAKTLAEHNRNVAKWRAIEAQQN